MTIPPAFTSFCRRTGIRLWDWLTAGTTGKRLGRLEGFFIRLLFIWIVLQSLFYHPDYTALPQPVGLAKWSRLWEWLGWDLTVLADNEVWRRCMIGVGIASVFYVFGIGLPLAVPVIALVQIGIRTLNNSQGAPHHGFQIISAGLIAQWIVVWATTGARFFALLRDRKPPLWAKAGECTAFWLFTIGAMTATYLVSVVTKLDESEGKWLANSHYVAAQVVKTHRQNYYNNLDEQYIQGVDQPKTGDAATDRYRHPVPKQAAWLQAHPLLARGLFGMGFLLETLAVLAVLGRWWALVIGWLLVTLHTGIEAIMELTFDWNCYLASFVIANGCGWIILMMRDKHYRPSWTVWSIAAVLEAMLLLVQHTAGNWLQKIANTMHAPGEVAGEIFQKPLLTLWGRDEILTGTAAKALTWMTIIGCQVLFLALLIHGAVIAWRRLVVRMKPAIQARAPSAA